MLDLSFLSLLIINRFLNPISDTVAGQKLDFSVRCAAGRDWRFPSKMVKGGSPKMDGFYMFLYIMEIPFTMDLGNGGYPKNIQVVGYDQWEHHRKWAAQMDWNLHI